MVPQRITRIRLMRECSWTNSDSSLEESGDSAQNERINVPIPAPQMRPRRSHVFSFSAEELEERINEGHECLVGFLLDARRFSTEFVLNYINREWELRGRATVLGRDDNRFLIHYEREIDRRVGVHANPWAIDVAIFVQQPWNPNIPLAQARLPRISIWLQIWDLPYEYQQTLVARRMTLSAGEVLQIDWENRRPRNIRFVRVRVSADLTVPLVPGCTLERDDGTSQWEVKRRINRGLNRTSQRHGLPIVVETNTTHFSNQMRAFLTRASRRNTRIGYRQGPQPMATDPPQQRDQDNQQGRIENQVEREGGNQQQALIPLQHLYIGNLPEQNTEPTPPNINQQEEPSQTQDITLQILNYTSPPPPNLQMQGEQNQVAALRELTKSLPNLEESNTNTFHRNLDQRIERLQGELSHLMQRHPNQPSPLIDEHQQEQYPLGPIDDPVAEFHNSVERIQRIHARYEGDFQNQADYDDMMFAFAREQSRFEHICQKIIRQSDYMLSGGGTMFTNAMLVQEDGNQAESSSMAERRSRESAEFQMSILLNGENADCLRLVGDGTYNFQMQDATNSLHPIQEGVEDQTQHKENTHQQEENKEATLTPGYRCAVNEEDFVSAFLKDSPTEEEQGRNIDGQGQEDKKGKRVRMEEGHNDTDSEDGRRIRQRLQSLDVNEMVAVMERQSQGALIIKNNDDNELSPDSQKRKQVWDQLIELSFNIPKDEEWIILGDFNQVLNNGDKLSDTSSQLRGAGDLQSCLDICSLAEVPNKGLYFTWSNRREAGQCTWERLDRAFANANWFQKFGNVVLTNLPITASDHSPLLLQFDKKDGFRRRPYRFEMMWSTNEQCEEVIKESWSQEVAGSDAFKLM
ncbi:Endonuclease/exonuclease/phosphatase [Corchorus olitorius]|uniref:Endonuclease/exonuclease/phosphatase n=1 Tax=Corchorus olitorius TaxID=93759 RepID=A0A1R3KUN5_9ROSI|nr:Endonuclease/exonuclease/phosphatase [Corchorus olitorius]